MSDFSSKQMIVLLLFIAALFVLFLPYVFESSTKNQPLIMAAMPQAPELPQQDKIAAISTPDNLPVQAKSEQPASFNHPSNAWVVKLDGFQARDAKKWLARLSEKGLTAYLQSEADGAKPQLYIGPLMEEQQTQYLKEELSKTYGLIASVEPFAPGQLSVSTGD